jgi:hypothetical protein
MRQLRLVSLVMTLLSTMVLAQSTSVSLISPPLVPKSAGANGSSEPDPAMQAKVAESYGKLPLSFEANHGQTDGRVKFLSRTGGFTLFLAGDEAVLALRGSAAKKPAPKGASGFWESARRGKPRLYGGTGGVLRMKLRNANPAAKISGTDELAGTNDYFIGNDPAKWHTSVPTYAKVKYEGIYSGIDLVYYGNQRQLEYDFIVAPGADPRRIAFDVSGAQRIRGDEHGDLVLKMKMGEDEIRWHKPVVYQEKDGARQLVAAHYAITDTNRVGFEVAQYDTRRPLYIDPLIYSTYLGGSGTDLGYGIAVDSAGNAYVTGVTQSTDFPTQSPLQSVNGGGRDVFVSKINAAGSALVYSTYLGGSGDDYGFGIAVDSAGNAYVTGYAGPNFPLMNPLQTTGGYFLSKINPAGSALVYSTYLNGGGSGVAVDGAGNAYVTGGGFIAAKVNASGSNFIYTFPVDSSGLGAGIAVDGSGNAYVTGTASAGFPTTPGAFQTTFSGEMDAFAAKIDPAGSAFVYSTYLGTTRKQGGHGIAVDSSGYAYVTGETNSGSFPTRNNLQAKCGNNFDGFVTKIDHTGSLLVYSTYLGGCRLNSGNGIAVDGKGNAYITGQATAGNFPQANPLKKGCDTIQGDAFLTKINPAGTAFVYSTCLGGSSYDNGLGVAVDSAGNAYVTGYSSSSDFPTLDPLQPAIGGGLDVFLSKIYPLAGTTTTLSSSPNPSISGQAVTFTAVVSSGAGTPPNGETVTFMKGTTVLGTGTLSGGSASFMTSTLPVGTNYIKAVYGGDSNFGGSTSKAVSQVVNKATTATTLTSSLNPSNFGQSVTFTANVTPQFGGTAKGSVTFYDGATALKTVALSGGVAKFTTSTLTSGSHSITATYNGSTSFDGSSASLTQTVN